MACLPVAGLFGQVGMGMRGGTWEGIWGLRTQPASILLCKDKAEINAFQVGVDVDNSYFYLARERFGLFGFGKRIKVDTSDVQLSDLGKGERAIIIDAQVQLPSFSLRLDNRSAIAFSSAARVAFTATDLDILARQFGLDTIELSIGESRQLDALRARQAAVTWSEHGFTYGRTFPVGTHGRFHAAATAKVAFGLLANTVDVVPATITGVNDSVDLVSNINADYQVVYPRDPVLGDGLGGAINGRGWNGDLGAIYELLPGDSLKRASGRLLRIGVAVTDLGRLNFTSRSETHRIRGGSATVEEIENFQLDRFEELGSAVSQLLLDDADASLVGRSFGIGLPTAGHLSVDYVFASRWAVRSELVIGLRSPPKAVAPRDVFALVPRFETRNVCVALPLTVDRVSRLAVGFSFRVGGFMIGSDRIGGLLGLSDVAGADLYFGAKVRIKGKAPAAPAPAAP